MAAGEGCQIPPWSYRYGGPITMQTSEALRRTSRINSERAHTNNGQRKDKQDEKQQSTTKHDGKTVHDPNQQKPRREQGPWPFATSKLQLHTTGSFAVLCIIHRKHSIQIIQKRPQKTKQQSRLFSAPGHDVICDSAAAVANHRTLHYRRIIPGN